jgi:hypothetical protein
MASVGRRWPIRDVGIVVAGVALVTLAVGLGLSVRDRAQPAGLAGLPEAATATPTSAAGLTPLAGPTVTGRPTAPSTTRIAPTTPPRSTGRPGPPNTGVPAGTRLTVVNGDQTYRTDNQVISGLDIHGYVRITARNVTLKNSIVRGGAPRCNAAVIQIVDGASATIVDTEIDAANPNPCLDGIFATSATLTRLKVHNVVDGVKAYDNVVLQDSYVYGLSWFASDPNQGGGATHNDCVQTYEGNHSIVLRRNTLDAGPKGNAAYQVTQDFGGVSEDLHIEGNWLDGGGCTLNFAHKGGPTPMTKIYVVNNRFGRGSTFNCPILVSTQTQLSQNTGNVWDDTGAPIPPPQRHD